MVYAKEGVLSPDPANTRLLLRLFNARFEERDKQDPRDLTKIRQGIEVSEGVFLISLQEFYKEYLSGRRLSSYTLPELIAYLKGLSGEEELKATVELHKRFAASLACVAFALIAIHSALPPIARKRP